MRILTIAEVAEFLRLSPVSVARAVKRGEIPSTPVGKRRVIVESELLEWLECRRPPQRLLPSESDEISAPGE